MRDIIREYFNQMLKEEISIEGAKENLLELIDEVAEEYE